MKTIHLYCDGSINPQKMKAGWGFVAVDPDTDEAIYEDCGFTPYTAESRNIDGECESAYQAVRWAWKKGYESIIVYHDYIGISKWAFGYWKTKKAVSKRYVERLNEMEGLLFRVDFVHVHGHSGNKWNDRADKLAEKGKLKLEEIK